MQQPAKPKPSEYGYDPINGWPDTETMERYLADLERWFDHPLKSEATQNEGDNFTTFTTPLHVKY